MQGDKQAKKQDKSDRKSQSRVDQNSSELQHESQENQSTNISKQIFTEKSEGRWTQAEHKRFVEALGLYGKNWKQVEDHVATRNGAQIRSHAQKFFNRLEREYRHQVNGLKSQEIKNLFEGQAYNEDQKKRPRSDSFHTNISLDLMSDQEDIQQLAQLQQPDITPSIIPNIDQIRRILNTGLSQSNIKQELSDLNRQAQTVKQKEQEILSQIKDTYLDRTAIVDEEAEKIFQQKIYFDKFLQIAEAYNNVKQDTEEQNRKPEEKNVQQEQEISQNEKLEIGQEESFFHFIMYFIILILLIVQNIIKIRNYHCLS